MATRLALKLADIVVTEAGFGADLGAEKFFDIKCRSAGLQPAAVVLVATVRALKLHGGLAREELAGEDLTALAKGIANLEKHIANLQKYDIPIVVAINRFPTDTEAELTLVGEHCRRLGVDAALSEVWQKGGAGGIELAEKVIAAINGETASFRFLYDAARPIKEKIATIAREIYGADGVVYTKEAERSIRRLGRHGLDKTPVCMAKTQYSLSDDPGRLGRPRGFTLTVRDVVPAAGAGFVVALTGEIMTMPGLPKKPAAESMDIDQEGRIKGLF